MSTIARIQIIKCDGFMCDAITSRQDVNIDDGWTGAIKHFCPSCKDSIVNADAVERDRAMAASILRRTLRTAAPAKRNEVKNAAVC